MAWKFCALVLCTEAAEVPLGCFLYGWKISDAIWGTPNPVNATDALHCQQICINTPHCETFGFQPAWKDCWLGSKMQVPARSSAVSFVSGPAKCAVAGQFGTGLSASPACALSPSSDFPGDTALQSASDFADDMVPVPLQCWPHLPNGELALCKGLPVETLEDTATGWPGKCLGLARTDLPMTEDCESSCRGNVSCASFQEVRTEGGLLQCWQGTGYDCFRDDAQVNVVQAKRFMHGHYRVLKDLRGYEVTGLQYAFAGSFFSDVNEAVKMCNHTCLSNIGCHAWRFSTGDGCWFDDPLRGSLTYPPSSKDFISNTEAAALVVAGEYIQRLCEVPQDLTGSTTFTSTLLPQIAVPLPGVVTPNVSAALPTVALPSLTTLAPTLAPNASNHTAATAATAAASAAAAAAAAAGVAATPTMAPLPEPVTPAPVTPVTLPTTTEPVATPPTTLRRHELNAKSRFFRLGSGQVFYKDENMVLHRVNGGCKDQGCVSEECASALEISEMIANSQALGEDFNCDLLAPTHGGSSGSGFNWTALFVSILFVIGCCSVCSFLAPQKYLVRRFPWLDSYLPSWFSGARHEPFMKLQEGRTYRGVQSMYEEDQLPLMYPGGPQFARAGVPPMAASMPMAAMSSLPPTQHLAPQMQSPENLWGSQYPGPLPPVDAGYDLVTVTPTGIEVTPLGETPPAGVPIVNPSFPMPVQYT